MKVLLITTEYPPNVFGGGGTFMSNLAQGLGRQNIETFILTKGKAFCNNDIDGFHIKVLRISSPNIPPRHVWFQLRSEVLLPHLIKKIKPDIIHANSFSAGLLFRYLDHKFPIIPRIVTIHGYPRHYLHLSVNSLKRGFNIGQISTYVIGYPSWEHMFRLELKLSNKVVTVAEFLKESIITDYNLDCTKVIHIPNGIDIENIETLADELHSYVYNRFLNINSDTYILVSSGRLYYEKGHLILIYALKKIVKLGFERILLYILGDGPLKPLLKKKIREFNLSRHIRLLGKLPYKKALYVMSQADVVVIPSIYEIMPMTLLEALALKKPVVTLNSCYVDEFKHVGIHLEIANNISDLANRIMSLLNEPDKRKIMRTVNTNYCILKKCFDIDVITKRYIELYNALIN